MARIRTIKPEFFSSHTIADLSLSARLTFIGLWTYVDDHGRAVDDPRLVRAAVWPLDDRMTSVKVEAELKTLQAAGLIRRYVDAAGKRLLAVTAWKEHQRVDKPRESIFPHPDECREWAENSKTSPGSLPEPSGNDPRRLQDASRGERKGREQGREGKGSDGGSVPGTVPESEADKPPHPAPPSAPSPRNQTDGQRAVEIYVDACHEEGFDPLDVLKERIGKETKRLLTDPNIDRDQLAEALVRVAKQGKTPSALAMVYNDLSRENAS